MNLHLKNKRVLVTGSSRGIGLSVAKGFLNENADVVLTSRNQSDLEVLASELKKDFESRKVLAFSCDFTNPKDVSRLRDFIVKSWNGLDILIANVGSGKSVTDAIAEKKHFDTVFMENFESAVNVSREFLPLIEESKGNILFISSIAGMEIIGAPTDYSVAKAAVVSFSKNLAWKVAKNNVRVNCISPGNIFFKGGTWEEKINEDADRVKKLIDATVPMERFGKPEEITSSVLFLCSDQASFITGCVLCVDGGQTRAF